MCGLCGVLGSEHWADEGGDRRRQVLRTALLERVLRHSGLGVQEWAGRYVVRNRTGRSLVALDLPSVWVVAAELAGGPLDPLDPALLDALEL